MAIRQVAIDVCCCSSADFLVPAPAVVARAIPVPSVASAVPVSVAATFESGTAHPFHLAVSHLHWTAAYATQMATIYWSVSVVPAYDVDDIVVDGFDDGVGDVDDVDAAAAILVADCCTRHSYIHWTVAYSSTSFAFLSYFSNVYHVTSTYLFPL